MSLEHATTTPPSPSTPPRIEGRARGRWWDLAAVVAFLAVGAELTWFLLGDPNGRHVAGNRQDSVQLRWLLAHAAQWFTEGESPIFTTLINAPRGVNLMANTSILALALPLAPVTLAFGPGVSAAVLLTLAPAATAIAWYHVLSRHVVASRLAAFVGALFAGFAPAMVSHDTGHPNIVAQAVLPYILLTVLRLRSPDRRVRTGLELAGLVVLQVFINEEMLFLTALTLAVFLLALLAFQRELVIPHVRSALVAAGVTTLTAGAVLAYPLWHQFFGPMAYRGLPTFVLEYGADLASFPAYATESLAGPSSNVSTLTSGVTEENAFFGAPLLCLIAVIAVWLARRNAIVKSLCITGVVLATLSLGSEIVISGRKTGIAGPWAALERLPLFDSVVPTRLALFLTPLIAILLAMAVERISRFPDGRVPRVAVRLAAAAAFAAALVPIAPTPIAVAEDPATPRFFTSGAWRRHLPSGASILPIPLGWDENVDVMQWQLAVRHEFVTPGGYYLAPGGGQNRRARFGPELPSALARFTDEARRDGDRRPITLEDREAIQRDLRKLRVDALVLPDGARNAGDFLRQLEGLVGPGEHVVDVWFWDVRQATVAG